MLIYRLINHYKNIYYRSTKKFILIWISFALTPLVCSFVFDQIAIYATGKLSADLLLVFLNIFTITVVFALLIFLTITMWAAFGHKIDIKEKFIMILSSYVLIWFAYGNLYYFSCDVDNYDRILKVDKTLLFDSLQEESIKVQFQTPIKGIGNFWQWSENLGLKPVNRIDGFLDCLYFSGVTMLTVGYGDITPVSRLLRFFSILQGFLGQIIVVVAMGIWINQITARNKSA